MIPDRLIEALRSRYAEPQRRYHTWAHITALLRHFTLWYDAFHRPEPVLWALYWHDAIYDPMAADNEEQSAQLLEREAAGHLSAADLAFAAAIIRATATHSLPEGPGSDDLADMSLFLDLDLSILGAPEAVYDQYARDVRAEYAHVPEDRFRAGRAAVLQRFLSRPRLYFTERGHAEWDAAARANLARELRSLEPGA